MFNHFSQKPPQAQDVAHPLLFSDVGREERKLIHKAEMLGVYQKRAEKGLPLFEPETSKAS